MPKDERIYVGVDLGGTKILAVAFDSKLKVLATEKAKTPREANASSVVAALTEAVRAVLDRAGKDLELGGVGVSVPGPLDRAKGIVRYTPNMGFKDYKLSQELVGLFGAPAFLENDVQAGVYGELRAGALRGKMNAVGVFVGTGIGGGIVIDGKLYRGATGSAGEVGHMVLLEGGAACGCGNYGCLEALASRTAMAKDGDRPVRDGQGSRAVSLAGSDLRKCRSGILFEAIESGDKGVKKAVDRAASWLGDRPRQPRARAQSRGHRRGRRRRDALRPEIPRSRDRLHGGTPHARPLRHRASPPLGARRPRRPDRRRLRRDRGRGGGALSEDFRP